jgi:hypothetical protein
MPSVSLPDGSSQYAANAIEHSADVSASAPLIHGGLGGTPNPAWAGKIVLLDRGSISFADKVRNVQTSGGLAVIIANNVAGAANEGTLGAGKSSTIPAVAVSLADGAALKAKVGTSVNIRGPNNPADVVVPDPAGHLGELLCSDGGKLVYRKPLDVLGSVSVSAEQTVGKPVSFSVSAAGAPPFTYQWSHNGAAIAGATGPTHTIASVTGTDAGTYVCVVSSANGATPSAVCTLVVK